jgi:CheY-like chemotaxis protein
MSATSAEEAVRVLQSAPVKPHVILADYHLDDGATGLQAVARVRSAVGAALPAVIITADYSAEVQHEIRGAGLALLRKPVKAAMLRALLSQHALQRAAAE